MRALITAGPTREPVDAVRFLSNRSTGKMGFALARVGAQRGHEVTLITGPVALEAPPGIQRIDVVTAEEMKCAVESSLEGQDILIMAAAVSDWRPRKPVTHKQKKAEAMDGLSLELERTCDILTSVRKRKGRRLHVGFAAETHNVLGEARRKLRDKGLDLIVANDVGQPDAGFVVDTNRVTFLTENDEIILPCLSKNEVADRIWQTVESFAGAPKSL